MPFLEHFYISAQGRYGIVVWARFYILSLAPSWEQSDSFVLEHFCIHVPWLEHNAGVAHF